MKVVFHSIEYKNFRSIGNSPIRIQLDKDKITLVSGPNGSGKTSVVQALCFGLFGRGYGNISKPSLINSINQKQLLVTVEFSIGKKKYKINRGMKPNIFEIFEEGKLISQDPSNKDYQKVLEQQILKFNYRSFTQVVIVGGGLDYVPFMRLPAKERREFVEDLLDIRIFSTMNMLVKDQHKLSKDELKEVTFEINSLKEMVVVQESFINKLKSERSSSADKIQVMIADALKDTELSNTQLNSIMMALKKVELKLNQHSELDDKLTELRLSIKQLNGQIIKKEQQRVFYNELDVCPTCSQVVGDSQKEIVLGKVANDIASINDEVVNLLKSEEDLKVLMQDYDEYANQYRKLNSKATELNNIIYSNNAKIVSANKQLSDLTSDTSSIDAEVDKQKVLAINYVSKDKKKKELLELQLYQEYIQQILSDSGIKTKIIKQYIPTINKLINKYLGEMDFFVSFHLDEQFNETIKSRHRDTFSYDNFSDGQKRRIDLSILLTWMEIAKAKNSLHTNVSFFDEADSSLDAAGADMLHAALKSCSSENIFLISHKGDVLADKCDEHLQFRVHNGFTEFVPS